MKVIGYLVICTFVLSVFACKTDGTSNNTAQNPTKVKPQTVNEAAAREIDRLNMQGARQKGKVDVVGLRAQALSILNHRLKKETKTYASIESGIWEYQFVFEGKMSEPGQYKGVWIDFKNDHTYNYGINSKVEGSGRYNYQFDRGELLIVDNDAGRRPQEFTAKLQNDAMVLIGTNTYGDRNIQMKLEKAPDTINQG